MRIIKLLLIVFFVSVFGFGIYHSLFRTELTIIKDLVVTGGSDETKARLGKVLKIPSHTSFWKADVQEIATKVKKDSWVEDVEIKKIFPDKIEVRITERKPEAVINRGSNQFAFVDSKNNVFGPAPAKEISNHIILSGKALIDDVNTRAKALEILPSLRGVGPITESDVSEMFFTHEKGFEIVLSKTGIKVELGKENIPLHIDRARRVVQYLNEHQINATHVDADYAKKVLVKVRKDR